MVRGANRSGSSSLRRRLQEELSRGRLDASKLLLALLGRSPEVDAAVSDAASQQLRDDQVDPRVARYVRLPATTVQQALRVARRRFLGLEGVVSVHWGLRERAGDLHGQPCIVVTVRRKRPRAGLSAAERIPRSIVLDVRGRRRHVPIDVQPAAEPGELYASEARPGNYARMLEPSVGQVGALVEAGGQIHILTAGHVVRTEGLSGRARAVTGQVFDVGTGQKVVVDARGDAGRIGPLSSEAADYLGDYARKVRNPVLGDQGRSFRIVLNREPLPVVAMVKSPICSAVFRYNGEDVEMQGLCGLEDLTRKGDSGAPVLDAKDNIVGFVVGSYRGETVIMPARRAISVAT